jgi:putative membrane-bound dehydrogenase-like protein
MALPPFVSPRFFSRNLLTASIFAMAAVEPALAQAAFRAGAAAVDITPLEYPVRVNGNFVEGTATAAVDPIHARALALDDGASKLVFCIVDTCMMTRELIDGAKAQVASATGIPMDRMMVSATHTHTAPASMGCLGSRPDPAYTAWLPGKLVEAMTAALNNLQPAQIGWSSIDDWEHTHNRRWIRRADKMLPDPFGETNVRANMHPGYESPDIIGPSGPVDPELSVLAVKTPDGKPIAVLANYSQHYFGSTPISADYYGHFCRQMAALLGESSSEGEFVAMISQGTSGDLMWMDYGSPPAPPTIQDYAAEVAGCAIKAYHQIEWRDAAPLAISEKKITLNFRVPDEKRLAWAREQVQLMGDRLPMTQPEVYAHEAIYLHERPTAELVLQAIQIGDLGITTLPNEVFALTGLKLKAQSPLEAHFNIELANGAEGYIPPPEQHTLGGYTTWPARTAGLEVEAEPRIVETLLGAMEEATGKPRRTVEAAMGPYAEAVMKGAPTSYWRMEEMAGVELMNTVPGGPEAKLSGDGFARYLPGVASGSGIGAREALAESAFSGPDQINRAVHIVRGHIRAQVAEIQGDCSVALWFWLGEASGASDRKGDLLTLPGGGILSYANNERHETTLGLRTGNQTATSASRFPANQWHFVVAVREGDTLRVYLDGAAEPVLTSVAAREPVFSFCFGLGLEGKLDEIAVYPRALPAAEIANLWEVSGVAKYNAEETAEAERRIAEFQEKLGLPKFSADYETAIAAMKPVIGAPLDGRRENILLDKGTSLAVPVYAGGRIRGAAPGIANVYSVSLWFKNQSPNDANPITAYLFSRGPVGDPNAIGEHLGISGNHQPDAVGKLNLYNGNTSAQTLFGKSVIAPGSWSHLVLVRNGEHATVYLNGNPEPEIDGALPVTASSSPDFYLGARSDQFAPLNGGLASFAFFDRALTAEEAGQLYAAAGVDTAAQRPGLASLPRSPEEGLKSIRVPEGFTVDLVAAEPLLLDPVAFDWDTQGRLWVVEMSDYPLGLDGNGSSGGRVRMLEDANKDGTYEKSTLFAEGLSFPNGILTWRDGVIVTAAPDIVYLRDTDGDNVADEREVLLTGLTTGNQQLRANGLRWGLDNWVYVAAGGHHGEYGLETKITSSRNSTEVAVGSRDFRFRPDTGEVEPQSGPTQFGRNRDDWGHWFGTQNSRPLWHYVLQDHYLKRNPYLATPDGRVQVLGAINPPVFPASALEKRFHSFQESGRYTSACSGMIYRDGTLFPQDEMNGFTCEPFHNLVQRMVLEPEGASFAGHRAGEEGQPDFFASDDRWCRPVMVRTGPDGALWIADMYRYMIEHPDWLPEEGKAELLPFYREGDEKGRIYRVRRTEKSPQAVPALAELDGDGLVAQLASSNGWVRDAAQQLILWRGDVSVVPALEALTRSEIPQARLQALCTLDGLGALGEGLVAGALNDAHAGVRENALRLAESRMTPALAAQVATLAGDSDPKVRLQAAFTLGELPASPEAASALASILVQDHADPFVTMAALSSALPHQELLIAELAKINEPAIYALRPELAAIALGAGNKVALATLLAAAFEGARVAADAPALQSCVDLLDLLARQGTSVAALSEGAVEGPIVEMAKAHAALLEGASALMADENAAAAPRIASAALLARVPDSRAAAIDFLAGQIAGDTQQEAHEALDALAGTGDDHTPGIVLAAWPAFNRETKARAVDRILSRAPWAMALLDAVASNAIATDDIDPIRRSQLLRHPDGAVREAAAARLGAGSSPDRAKVIEDYGPALALTADVTKGHALYKESCSPCHRVGEEGIDMGPDLRTVSQHPPEKILANILDPNLDIQPGYHAYNCELNDGEQLFGIIASENATSITLKIAGGISRVLLRSDIYSMESTSMSFMPDGWEATLKQQDLADLIAFLKSTY